MINSLIIKAQCAKIRLQNRFAEEKGEVNIVATVVLIGIAVVLALAFRAKIADLLKSLFGTITTNSENVVGGGESFK